MNRCLLLSLILVLAGAWGPATAQSVHKVMDVEPVRRLASPGAERELPVVPRGDSVFRGRRGAQRVGLRGRATTAPGSSTEEAETRHFGHVLAGSLVGVAAGTSLGLLLWKGAAEAGVGEERYEQTRHDRPDAGAVLFGLGLVAFVGGGPVGAVQGAGLEERRVEGSVVAGVGEVTLGGLGYGLARRLGAGTAGQLLGMGVGAVLGTAAGATLVASKGERGAVTYRNGTWRTARPSIRVQPQIGNDGASSLTVTLLSMRW